MAEIDGAKEKKKWQDIEKRERKRWESGLDFYVNREINGLTS